MTSRPDRNQDGIIGVDLPAFLLSKSVRPDPVGAANFPLAVPGHPAVPHHRPNNKKPGVERRAKSPLLGGFARSSTVF
jgi:hypothetical protein